MSRTAGVDGVSHDDMPFFCPCLVPIHAAPAPARDLPNFGSKWVYGLGGARKPLLSLSARLVKQGGRCPSGNSHRSVLNSRSHVRELGSNAVARAQGDEAKANAVISMNPTALGLPGLARKRIYHQKLPFVFPLFDRLLLEFANKAQLLFPGPRIHYMGRCSFRPN